MKNLFIIALSLFALSCESKTTGVSSAYAAPPQQTTVASNVGDNLDLQALGELVRKSQNAQDIEDRLNSDNSINNLDLDEDGNVDYIRVTEYGSGNIRGFSFVAALNGDNQEVATIEIKKYYNNANITIYGNEGIYGVGCNYSYQYPIGQLLLYNYLFAPHIVYVSPYRYGYYPSRYRLYRTVPIHTYRNSVVVRHRGSYSYTRSYNSRPHYNSPNHGYKSRYVKNSSYNRGHNNNSYNRSASSGNNRVTNISNPNKSQKSFKRTESYNSRPNTNGFKSRNATPTYRTNSNYRPTTTTSNRSSSSPSRSSGFGSSSHSSSRSSGSSYSSGSSSRSSGSSSRSSGFGSSSRSSSRSSGSSHHSSRH